MPVEALLGASSMENHHHHNRELSQQLRYRELSAHCTAALCPQPKLCARSMLIMTISVRGRSSSPTPASQQAALMACMLIQALKTFPMKLFLQLSLLIFILSRSKWRMTRAAKGGPNHTMPFFQETKSPSKYYLHRDSDQSLGRLHIFPSAAIQ